MNTIKDKSSVEEISMIGFSRVVVGKYPSWIEVAGFKSIHAPTRIEIRPITLLAGINSSGKSSILQPLLLLKQSLEAQYDPDPLVLDGPHLSITSLDQILSRGRSKKSQEQEFYVAFGPMQSSGMQNPARSRFKDTELEVKLSFNRSSKNREHLRSLISVRDFRKGAPWIPVCDDQKDALLALMNLTSEEAKLRILTRGIHVELRVWPLSDRLSNRRVFFRGFSIDAPIEWTRSILHLPGYRGHRERRFPNTRVTRGGRDNHPFTVLGPMHPYTASLLLEWKRLASDPIERHRRKNQNKENLNQVDAGMKQLGLTWRVTAVPANAAELELRVGRMPDAQQGGAQDLVDIADVGYGLSQVLPVLVALAAAGPGQMVLIEQPELHLHPRAQLAMGRVLADAAKRGVIVVLETHSQLILRAIQTIVAQGYLRPQEVGLNWFSRDKESGWTTVRQADLQKDGSFGDWPVDFPDVYAMADSEFIEAVFANGGPV